MTPPQKTDKAPVLELYRNLSGSAVSFRTERFYAQLNMHGISERPRIWNRRNRACVLNKMDIPMHLHVRRYNPAMQDRAQLPSGIPPGSVDIDHDLDPTFVDHCWTADTVSPLWLPVQRAARFA